MNSSTKPQVEKQRESGIELFRIIAMLLIVAHHYVVNSGVTQLLGGDYFKDLFYYLFGMWGKTGINCFVLITGYFMCQSNITLRKFLKLFFRNYLLQNNHLSYTCCNRVLHHLAS